MPREIYTRRRIAAVVVLVIVLALMWFGIRALTNNDESESTNTNAADQASATSKSIDATSPVEPPNQQSAEPSATQDDKDKKDSESTDSKKKDVCTVADLEVTASPTQPTYGPDQQPSFYVNIKNPTDGDCSVDFDKNKLKFEVFTLNNYQRVWGDLDCNEPEVRGKTDIKAGEDVTYQLGAWSRTTSSPEECDNRQPVNAGSYLLYGHVGDNVSEPATFNLS